MFPDLSYILNYFFGTEVDNAFAIMKTFGLFLALVFLVSAYIVSLELKRKEKLGLVTAVEEDNPALKTSSLWDIGFNSFLGFVLGMKIPYIINHFDDFKRNPAGIIFSGEGHLIYGLLAAIVVGTLLFITGKKTKSVLANLPKRVLVHPHQRVGEFITLAAIFGLLGARLFSILENFSDFLKDPIGQLFSGSGLTIYGGLIMAFAVLYFYSKRKGIKSVYLMDSAAPALMLGYGIGRMGCQFSGDGDWGIVNESVKPSWFPFPDWAWSNYYPRNVLNEGIPIPDCVGAYCNQLAEGVYPTPIYEIVYSIIGFIILWSLRKKINIPGVIFFIYLLLTGIGRFFIEFIRVNPRYNYFGIDLSQAQYIAIVFILIALFGLYYKYKNVDKSNAV